MDTTDFGHTSSQPWYVTGPRPADGSVTVLLPESFWKGHCQIDRSPVFPVEPLFKVKLLNPKAKVPTKAYEGDLGWDLYSVGPYCLNHGHITMIQTGIAVQPRMGYGWIVKDRSSMAKAQVFTHGGVGDNGYRGEITVGLTCEDPQYYINEGDRVAQIVFVPIAEGFPMVVDELETSERGTRKWGSSGR
jgi:dUTP pyrophosphatase